MLELDKIRIDGGTQARVELNQETVGEYAELYATKVAMPAIKVYFDGSTFWLVDGFHRYFGAKKAGLSEILEEVIPGTLRDAILFSLGANTSHGLRRSGADKRQAVNRMLSDSEWAQWSDREIGRQCGVSHTFVSSVRSDLSGNRCQIAATKTVSRNGTTYQQNTANIGKTTSPTPTRATERAPIPTPSPAIASTDPQDAVDQTRQALAPITAMPIAAIPAYGSDDFGPSELEIIEAQDAELKLFSYFRDLLGNADDKLGAALAEIKRLVGVVQNLDIRIKGLMNEKNEAISIAASLRKKLDKIERMEKQGQ